MGGATKHRTTAAIHIPALPRFSVSLDACGVATVAGGGLGGDTGLFSGGCGLGAGLGDDCAEEFGRGSRFPPGRHSRIGRLLFSEDVDAATDAGAACLGLPGSGP